MGDTHITKKIIDVQKKALKQKCFSINGDFPECDNYSSIKYMEYI